MNKKEFIETWKQYECCDEEVIKFIADILYYENDKNDSIYNLFENGYCYYFAMMLKTAFNRGTVCWHRGHGHIVWVDDNDVAYDIGGVFYDYNTGDLLPVESSLGDMIVDFMHNGKEYKIKSPQFHDWAKRNNMSDLVAIATVYMLIPKQDLDDSKTVDENALLYWYKNEILINTKICKANPIKNNECYREYDNSKNITIGTIGDYVKLYGMNDKTKIRIVDESQRELFNDRVNYLQHTSEGCMHDLCSLKIKRFFDENEIEVYGKNYNGRKGVY